MGVRGESRRGVRAWCARLVVGALTVVTAGTGIVLAESAPAAAAPLDCTSSFFSIRATADSTQLFGGNPAAEGFDVPIGDPAPFAYNALGYNRLDGYLYGIRSDAPNLVRVHSDGTAEDLGPVEGLPARSFNTGDFDDQGTLWVRGSGSVSEFYGVDVATRVATTVDLQPDLTGLAADWGYYDGGLYSTQSGANPTIVRVDPTSGTATITPMTGAVSADSVWITGDGHMYAWAPLIGMQEAIDFDTTTPRGVRVAGTQPPTAAGSGDGAVCPDAPNPFIDAADDDYTSSPVGPAGGVAGNVFDNDTLRSAAFTSDQVTVSLLDDGGLTGATIGADGTLTVPAGVTLGTFDVQYQICDATAANVCDIAIARVLRHTTAGPFDCTSAFYTVRSSGTQSQLYGGDPATGGFNTPIGTTVPIAYNAIGYNPVDGYLYGIQGDTTNLVKVFSDGSVEVLGPVAGLPAGYYNTGAFDDTGTLWVGAYNIVGASTMFGVDVASRTARALTISPTVAGIARDWAFHDGALYTVKWNPINTDQAVVRIDPQTGASSLTPFAGARWGDDSVWVAGGHMFVFGNSTMREIVDFDTATPRAVTVPVASITNGGDGAVCANAASPFIDAVDNDYTATPVTDEGGVAGNVFENDTLQSAAFTADEVTVAMLDDGGLTGVTIGDDGALTVPAGAPAGTFAVLYEICDVATPDLCDSAIATVRVVAAPVDEPPTEQPPTEQPPTTTPPVGSPAGAGSGSSLATTGAAAAPPIAAGALALLVGAVLLFVARRKRALTRE